MGKTNKTGTTTKSALNNTPTNHLTSQGNGQPCAAEKTRATQARPPKTKVLTAGKAQLILAPETLKKTPSPKVLNAGKDDLILARAGQDALQSRGVTPVNSEPQVTMAGDQDASELTSSLKCKPPTVMAGTQDALQLSGTTSVYVIGEQEGRGGGNRSSDVSHAAGPPTRTTKEGLMGATTPPQGNQRDNNEEHRKDK